MITVNYYSMDSNPIIIFYLIDQRKENKEKKINSDNQSASNNLPEQGETSGGRVGAMSSVMETEENPVPAYNPSKYFCKFAVIVCK
mgnify:CR=1 FL=1